MIKTPVFRECHSQEEIIKHFMDASFNQSKITIWQNTNEGRVLATGKVILTDINLHKVRVHCDDDLHFSRDFTTYFYINHENILFKLTVDFSTENPLMIPVPYEVKIKENRDIQREIMPFDDVEIVLSRFSEFNTSTYQMAGIIKDHSTEGIGVYISNRNISRYSRGDMMSLISINSEKLKEVVTAKICYVRPSDDPKYAKSFRVGLQFSTPYRVEL